MKYSAKEIKDNVNVTAESPIKGFLDLLGRIVVVLLLVYLVLGVAVDYIAPRLSVDAEIKIGKLYAAALERKGKLNTEEKIQVVVDDLLKHSAFLPEFKYKVYVLDSKDENALALPGGRILILSGLLNNVKSQNELAMILAHELGHFSNRDHLKGIGRGLVFLTLSTLAFGADSSVSRLIADTINSVERSFSQAQEKTADLYALDLLNKTYGHAGGAVDFYRRMADKEKYARFLYVFSTHPRMKDRLNLLNEAIKNNGYKEREKTPINIGYKFK